MNDTSPAIQAKWNEMWRKKSLEERFLMGCSMFDSAKEIVTSSILEENPDISLPNLREKFFLRFYQNDFSPESLRKILDWINR